MSENKTYKGLVYFELGIDPNKEKTIYLNEKYSAEYHKKIASELKCHSATISRSITDLSLLEDANFSFIKDIEILGI